MKSFICGELGLKKDIKICNKESLLSLFDAVERFKPMTVLTYAEEDRLVGVAIGQLGKIDLKLGADMKSQKEENYCDAFLVFRTGKNFQDKEYSQRRPAYRGADDDRMKKRDGISSYHALELDLMNIKLKEGIKEKERLL